MVQTGLAYNRYIQQPRGVWDPALQGAKVNHSTYGVMEPYNNNGMIALMGGTDANGNPIQITDINEMDGLQGITPDGQAFQFGGQGTSGLSNAMGYIGAGADILQGLSGLANAYMGYKNYKLAKEQFGFQKGLANRNLANQAKVINNTYDNAAQVAAGMIGGGSYNPATDTQGSFGMVDQATVDQYAKKAKEKHVDGSSIG